MEHSTQIKINRTKPGTKLVVAKHELVKTDATLNKTSGASSTCVAGVSVAKAARGGSLADSNTKLNSATPSLQKNAQNNYDKTDAQAAGAEDSFKPKTLKRSSSPEKIKIGPNPSTNSVHIVTHSASVLAANASKKGSGLLSGSSITGSTTSSDTGVEDFQIKPASNARSKRSRGVAHHDKQLAEAERAEKSSCNSEVQKITPALSQNDHSGHDLCVGPSSVGTVTEPDCLGPCEPGTAVTLEGIVWHENENGVLVVNVTWRGKSYAGTLLDCTKNEWAPPRFCETPTSDIGTKTPKNRARRSRAQGSGTPLVESGSSALDAPALRLSATKLRNGTKGRRGSSNISASFLTPLSPLKVEPFPERKTRGSKNDAQEEASTSFKSAKRIKISSKESSSNSARAGGRVPTTSVTHSPELGPYSPVFIECPAPNCSKKYKHLNGLKYHQSHAHTPQCVAAEDSDPNMSTASTTTKHEARSTKHEAKSNLVSTSNQVDDVGDSSMAELIDLGVDGKLEKDGDSSTTIDNGCDRPNPSIPNTTGCTGVDSYVNQFSKGKAKDSNPNTDGGVQELYGQTIVNPLGRTPILTIPSFVSSVQTRSMTQQQGSSRTLNCNDKSHESERADGFTSPSKGSSVPWQPHVSSSIAHVAPLATPVISSIQSGHGQNHRNPVPRLGDQHGKKLKSDGPAEESLGNSSGPATSVAADESNVNNPTHDLMLLADEQIPPPDTILSARKRKVKSSEGCVRKVKRKGNIRRRGVLPLSICNLCNIMGTRNHRTKCRFKNEHPAGFPCKICNYVFKQRAHLKRHKLRFKLPRTCHGPA